MTTFLASPLSAASYTPDELALARKVLSQLQPTSIEKSREMCGYIWRDTAGTLRVSEVHTGREATCDLPDLPASATLVASFHTHSSYSPDYDSEVPSTIDMRSDYASGLRGWIVTPGGRLWLVDGPRLVTQMICGAGCLPADPDFVDEPPGTLRRSYTYDTLLKRESGY